MTKEKVNLIASLNSLNSNFAVSNSVQSKYDWDALNIAKSQRTSTRRKIRKNVLAVYKNVETATKEQLKEFTSLQESILLCCTKTKNTFKDLKVNQVIPKFETCTKDEQKELTVAHNLIISKIK